MTVHISRRPSFVPVIGGAVPTFSRESIGWSVNSAGLIVPFSENAPRFYYDPVTKALQGLLIEGYGRNSLLYCDSFDNAAWTKTNVTVSPDNATAPDGTTTADRLTSTSDSAATCSQTVVADTTNQWSYSIYAKQGSGAQEANSFALRNDTTAVNLFSMQIDYSNGQIIGSSGAGFGSVTPAGNNWWRIKMGVAVDSITAQDSLIAYACFNGNTNTSADYAYVWRPQLEPHTFPSSPIQTTTAAIIRSGDDVTVDDISIFYNLEGGSLYVEFYPLDPSGTTSYGMASFDDTTLNNIIGIGTNGTALSLFSIKNGVASSQVNSSNIIAGAVNVIAGAWSASEIAVSGNGGATSALSTTNIPAATVTRLRLGAASYWHYATTTIRKIAYYAERLSNSELQALSGGGRITKRPVLAFDFTTDTIESWGHGYA